jgi:D-alanyl-D-alanine carboxypeptidase (penicillin-binding protein 5/6)
MCALGMLGLAVAAQGAAAGPSLPPGGPAGSAVRAPAAAAFAALSTSRPAAPLADRPPTLRAAAAILIDLDTGAELYAKRPTDRRPIASLAKVMTAILVLQRTRLSDVVTVSPRAAHTPPTDMGLRPLERVRVKDLLYGLLLRSGNDAAVALAERVSGSVRSFLALMNRQAGILGLTDTYFASPNGLNDRGYSTARDLAILTRAAMADPTFATVVSTGVYWMPVAPGRYRRMDNINLFLGQYAGAIGVKTGYTHRAGDCLAAAARVGGRSLLAVVLGEPTNTHWIVPFADAAKLLSYGFGPPIRRTARS